MPREPHVLRRAVAIAGISALVAVAGCTGERPVLSEEPQVTTTQPEAGSDGEEPPPEPARLAAESTVEIIPIYASADATEPDLELSADETTSTPGAPLIFRVIREQGDRFEVELPTAPIGTTGWVDDADVDVRTITYRIQLLLSSHRLRVFDVDDDVVVDERITVGDGDRPEPGSYFLTELLQAPESGGTYGSFAYVFSGSRVTASAFESGSGLVGLHGGADEDALGENTSIGSIGVTDEVIDRLINEVGLQLGTPVQIID